MDINDANVIFEKYKAGFDSLGALIYSQSPAEDIIMLRWWMHLTETGDINRLMLPDARRLSPFLNVFKWPLVLIYSLDANNQINNAFWAAPNDNTSEYKTAYCGMWCRADGRGKRRQLDFTIFVYTFAFEFYEAILGMTWQPDLLDIHQKLGYSIVGCVPKLYDEDFLYIVHLTREAFSTSRIMQVNAKRRK